MPKLTYDFKIKEVSFKPKEINTLCFPDKIRFNQEIQKWKESGIKSTWASQKRQSFAKAMKEFKDLYQPTEYFVATHTEKDYWDDTFEVFYKSKAE